MHAHSPEGRHSPWPLHMPLIPDPGHRTCSDSSLTADSTADKISKKAYPIARVSVEPRKAFARSVDADAREVAFSRAVKHLKELNFAKCHHTTACENTKDLPAVVRRPARTANTGASSAGPLPRTYSTPTAGLWQAREMNEVSFSLAMSPLQLQLHDRTYCYFE